MKNITDKDLLYESQLNENTYNRNKVTTTLGSMPKELYTKTTEKMVKEYKDEMDKNREAGLRSDSFIALVGNTPDLVDLVDGGADTFAFLETERVSSTRSLETYLKRYKRIKNEIDIIRNTPVTDDYIVDVTKKKTVIKSGITRIEKEDRLIHYNGLLKDTEHAIDYFEHKLRDNAENYERTKLYMKTMDQENKEKLNEYKQAINNTNNTYIRDQSPGESDIDYQQYIKEATQPLPDATILKVAELDQLKKIKNNFSDIFNTAVSMRLSLIEDIIQKLSLFDGEQIYNTNTNWATIKKKLIDTYGYDNANVTVDNVIKIIAGVLGINISEGSSSSSSSSSGSSRHALDLAKDVEDNEDKKHGKANDTYDQMINVGDGNINWYVIIIRHNNNLYVGVSQSGQKGTFKVKPGFSTFSTRDYANTFVKQTPNDIHKIKPIDFWGVDDFNSDIIIYNNFKSRIFTRGKGEVKLDLLSINSDEYMKKGEPLYKWKHGKNIKTSGRPNNDKREQWIREKVETKQPIIGAGISIPQHDKIIKFGNVLLLYDRLIKHNMLSVKKKGGGNIENFKNVRVSDKFVDIITGAINKQNINDIYNELNEEEQHLYNILVQISGIHKYVKIPGPNVKFLKDKLKLIEGEIDAGNDNNDLIQQMADVLNKLVIVKMISKKQAIQHMAMYNKIK